MTARTGTERQTCCGCLATVGTLPSGDHRPYVTTRYPAPPPCPVRGPLPARSFHYCANDHYVSVAAAIAAGADLVTYDQELTR